jgi:hypothetical protein
MTPEDKELFDAIQARINDRYRKRERNIKYGPIKTVRQRKSRMPPLADDLDTLVALFKKYLLEEPKDANPE